MSNWVPALCVQFALELSEATLLQNSCGENYENVTRVSHIIMRLIEVLSWFIVGRQQCYLWSMWNCDPAHSALHHPLHLDWNTVNHISTYFVADVNLVSRGGNGRKNISFVLILKMNCLARRSHGYDENTYFFRYSVILMTNWVALKYICYAGCLAADVQAAS